jgi:Uma2 family endonuclease
MIAMREEPVQRLRLSCVPWSGYLALLEAFDERPIHVTYDRGELEIMTLGREHEYYKTLLGRLIETMTMVLRIRMSSGGSITMNREALERGLESDECYWIQHEALVRGKMDYDIETDPPPDLALEIDVSSSSINRMGIYATLRIPEVWRLCRKELTVHHLAGNGQYREKNRSRAFPFLPMDEIRRFVRDAQTVDETTLLCSFQDWVRDTLLPTYAPAARKTGKARKHNGKKSGR